MMDRIRGTLTLPNKPREKDSEPQRTSKYQKLVIPPEQKHPGHIEAVLRTIGFEVSPEAISRTTETLDIGLSNVNNREIIIGSLALVRVVSNRQDAYESENEVQYKLEFRDAYLKEKIREKFDLLVQRGDLALVEDGYGFNNRSHLEEKISTLAIVVAQFEALANGYEFKPKLKPGTRTIDIVSAVSEYFGFNTPSPAEMDRIVSLLETTLKDHNQQGKYVLDTYNNFYAQITRDEKTRRLNGNQPVVLSFRAQRYSQRMQPYLEQLYKDGILIKIGENYAFRNFTEFHDFIAEVMVLYNLADASHI